MASISVLGVGILDDAAFDASIRTIEARVGFEVLRDGPRCWVLIHGAEEREVGRFTSRRAARLVADAYTAAGVTNAADYSRARRGATEASSLRLDHSTRRLRVT